LACKATDVDDETEDPRFGKVGKQTIKDTGPLTRKRMETVENDLLDRSLDFIDRAHAAEKPFLLWHNTTRMHVWTHLSGRWKDKTGLGVYADGMAELDWVVGERRPHDHRGCRRPGRNGCTSSSRTTGSPAPCSDRPSPVRRTCGSTPSNSTWTHPPTRSTPARSSGPCSRPLPSSSSTQPPSTTSPRQPPPDFNPQQMLERVLHAAAAQ
jgi:hypothetical protein